MNQLLLCSVLITPFITIFIFLIAIFYYYYYVLTLNIIYRPQGNELATTRPDLRVRFIVPEAPIAMGSGSFAWWPIDYIGRTELYRSGQIFKFVPPGIDVARNAVLKLVAEQLADCAPGAK